MVVAIRLLAEVAVFKGMSPSGVVSLPMSVELNELVGRVRGRAEEGCEELFQVLVVGREDRVGR